MVHNFSPRASSAMEGVTKMKFGTRVARGKDDAQTLNTHSAHIAQRKHAIPQSTKNRTCAT